MNRMLRILFHMLVVRPFVYIVIGLRIIGRERLPSKGPAVVIANHNSHLDTAVLMSLFPLSKIHRIRPAAAADFFLTTPLREWFSRELMGIVPVDRHAREKGEDPFEFVTPALEAGNVLVVFPEGTRGEPDEMAELKKGISHLIEAHQDVAVTPVFLRGLGRSLPRGSWLPVPFFCDVNIGEPIHWTGDRESYMYRLRTAMQRLEETGFAAQWE